MKVLNLQCEARHVFEGWFASEEDFAGQCERGLLTCPVCGATTVHKLPSAPRLNLGAAPAAPAAAQATPGDDSRAVLRAPAADASLQAAWLQLARRIVAGTEDVGERFAEQARQMHYGEIEERAIRGKVSRTESQALLEEGIAVLPLPLPEGLEGPMH